MHCPVSDPIKCVWLNSASLLTSTLQGIECSFSLWDLHVLMAKFVFCK